MSTKTIPCPVAVAVAVAVVFWYVWPIYNKQLPWVRILERLTNVLAPFFRTYGVETAISYDCS